MPGAHRDLKMWKALQGEDMLKSFDVRNRKPAVKIDNYKWMVPNQFKDAGHYYNAHNNHWHLNPKHTKPGKYGYNRADAINSMGNLKSQYNMAGGEVEPDFQR